MFPLFGNLFVLAIDLFFPLYHLLVFSFLVFLSNCMLRAIIVCLLEQNPLFPPYWERVSLVWFNIQSFKNSCMKWNYFFVHFYFLCMSFGCVSLLMLLSITKCSPCSYICFLFSLNSIVLFFSFLFLIINWGWFKLFLMNLFYCHVCRDLRKPSYCERYLKMELWGCYLTDTLWQLVILLYLCMTGK